MKAKVMDSGELIAAIHVAERRGYKRRIKADVIDKLDDDGLHVIVWSLITGPDSNMKVRAQILMKFKGDDEPHPGWLDIDVDKFNKYRYMSNDKEDVGKDVGGES